jgi:HlyD family secretion protein
MRKQNRFFVSTHALSSAGERAARCANCAALAALLGTAVFAASGCKTPPEVEANPVVGVQVAGAVSQPIDLKVVADGTLYPLDQAAIVPKITSPVKKFYVERGSHVRSGELLAELESEDLAGALAENQGSYASVDAAYQASMQKSKSDLDLLKQAADAAQRVYDARRNLLEQGAASAKDVEDAQIALAQAKAAYDTAQKQYDLKVAEGDLNAAKGRTATAEAQLSYSKITSPIDGVVTDRPFYPGETAPAGAPLVTVMNLSQVIAKAHVAEQAAAKLKIGDAATLSGPGVGSSVRGKVTLVSPALDPSSTTVEVWAQFPNADGHLKPGSSAQVTLIAETIPHAVVVPTMAILTDDNGAKSVMILDTADNSVHKKSVQVGIQDGPYIQVTKGLSGGERVVTVGAFELFKLDEDELPKTKVQVQSPKGADAVLEPDEDDQ